MRTTRHLATLATLVGAILGPAWAEEPKPLPEKELTALHRMIKPQAGESRWMEIDWHPSVWEGRIKAAAEGKPLLIWAGSGGAPAAGC